MNKKTFHRFVRGENRRDDGEAWLEAREIPEAIGDHKVGAQHYQADKDLEDAINAALAVGAPLLLTGDPGTGKTQVAYHLAHYFGIENRLYKLDVKSITTVKDLLYDYDAVSYFHAAHDHRREKEDLRRSEFVRPGPLWKAIESRKPSVVLIDEIDKAPRDFPNDLLNVLDQHEFEVPESETTVALEKGQKPPIIVITSNNERQLPAAFLRRCIFHHIELTEDLVYEAVRARIGDFPRLTEDDVLTVAIRRFHELRRSNIRKKPALAELLVWLTILNARGVTADELGNASLKALPAGAALVKDREDQKHLS